MIRSLIQKLRRAARPAVCALAALALLSGAAAGIAEEAEPLRVIFMDVGKGDCILISKGGTYVLIDAGYAETAADAAALMRQEGVERLDAMILTHYDKDHVGGATEILDSFPVGQIYLPGYQGEGKYYETLVYAVQKRGLPAEKVTEDVSFTLAGVRYDIFATKLSYIPGEDGKEGNDNDVSLVVAAAYGADAYLFAGDIEQAGIESYLAAGHGTYDVVKMPHHGQNEKNSDDFIGQVQMKIAVITDSEEEAVKKKMRKQLAAVGAEVYCSSENGRITVTSDGSGTYGVVTER